jgi:hypothetical protein
MRKNIVNNDPRRDLNRPGMGVIVEKSYLL